MADHDEPDSPLPQPLSPKLNPALPPASPGPAPSTPTTRRRLRFTRSLQDLFGKGVPRKRAASDQEAIQALPPSPTVGAPKTASPATQRVWSNQRPVRKVLSDRNLKDAFLQPAELMVPDSLAAIKPADLDAFRALLGRDSHPVHVALYFLGRALSIFPENSTAQQFSTILEDNKNQLRGRLYNVLCLLHNERSLGFLLDEYNGEFRQVRVKSIKSPKAEKKAPPPPPPPP